MRVTDGLEMFDLPVILESGPSVIHPVLIWNNDDVILVDTGLPGQLPQLQAAMEKAGIPFERLNKVIITHHDMDHIGSLKSILSASSRKVEVLAHEAERPYIQGEIPPIRLTQLEATLSTVSGERLQRIKLLYENLKSNYVSCKADVSKTVADGEELPYCDGIVVIYTPGHTLGHISLYHKQSKTLIAGDIMNVADQLLRPAPQFTIIDKDLALQSLKKLIKYDIKTVICYHGGMYNYSDTSKRITELACDMVYKSL